MTLRTALIALCCIGLAGAATAQTQTATPSPGGGAISQTGGTRVHGTVTDPDGELIPGASITLTPTKGNPVRTKSAADGTYAVTVTPGSYTLSVTMQGFKSYSASNVRIVSGPGVTLDAKLAIGEQNIVVNVDATGVELSVDPENNASSTVLRGADLDALSDDPDELQSELQALAGPAAGPNGGQIYVDGFTGGQLPPKSSIREIRINQNPFSAQYDKLGYGRIEVFTKPGTDKLHGSFQINGNPSQFDSGDPPNAGGTYQPPYHTIFMFGSITGPLGKNASYNIGGSHRDIEQDEYTLASGFYGGSTSGLPCAPGSTGPGCTQQTNATAFTYNPAVRTDINPRLDLALGSKNVLTTRYQFVSNSQINEGVGNLTLPDAAYNGSSTSNILQLSDTQTFTPKLINEMRFEYERERTNQSPLNSQPYVSVLGAFNAGGAPSQYESDHQDHIEFQNYTSVQLNKHFLRLGGRLRSTREAQYTSANTNGTFDYTSIAAYINNQPRQFDITQVNVPSFRYTLVDLGVYAEDEWKPNPNLVIDYGFRYETQNHLSDHHDIAPRVSFNYGLGHAKNGPLVVVHGGFGLFYDRFPGADILNLIKENGTNETIYTLSNTYSTTGTVISQQISAACTPYTATYSYQTCTAGQSAAQQQTYTRTPNLRTDYIEQTAFGIDKGLGRIGTVSVNYIHSLGVHQLASQNIGYNFANPLLTTPTFQYFSEGQFHQDQMVVNARVQVSKYLSLFGFYGLGFAAGDSTGAGAFISQPGNIQADYGRTMFDTRSHAFVAGSLTLPHFIQFSPFIIAQSGNPYNITSGNDNNNDLILNDRPYLVTGLAAPSGTGVVTKTIAGCGTFSNVNPGGAVITPINYCTGPALFAFNFRLTKTWGFGEMRNARSGSGDDSGRHSRSGSSGMSGGSMGGPPGGGGSRGSSGGFGGGGTSTGHRYNFGLGLQAQNVFGNSDLATPNGTLTSNNFGLSTQLAGQPYTNTNAIRRISLQASFNF